MAAEFVNMDFIPIEVEGGRWSNLFCVYDLNYRDAHFNARVKNIEY